ncbi:hypothetical protein BHU41_07020 [Lactobacillus crispatus]|uniref:Uncharacterized protein n=1 Tax=Lactobacillus crispatus TaxID=47770 RepID=A0A2M9WP82_9LACO|nr:hypothetical protein BHU41_07020 [Lactobacillus crispatus]
MCFFVQTNHTRKELLFLMFKEINLRNHSSLHKLFYSLGFSVKISKTIKLKRMVKPKIRQKTRNLQPHLFLKIPKK